MRKESICEQEADSSSNKSKEKTSVKDGNPSSGKSNERTCKNGSYSSIDKSKEICKQEADSLSSKSKERTSIKGANTSSRKSNERISKKGSNSSSAKSKERTSMKRANTSSGKSNARKCKKGSVPSSGKSVDRISIKEADPSSSISKERTGDKEVNPASSTSKERTSEKETNIIRPDLASALYISDHLETHKELTTTVRRITVRDLGGVYEAMVPITDWDRYLDVELALFRNRIKKGKITFSSRKEFKFVSEIGSGSYGKVALVIKRDSGRYYAAKFISRKVLKRKEIKQCVMNERSILLSIRFTFTIYLEYFIQDLSNLYFILPIALGGNLDSLIKKNGKLTENFAKFYAAQIVLALEYLHYMTLIYRDLKPGNILLDHFGFIKLTDFGFSKILKNDKTYTMCGTAEYLAPEVILCQGYDRAADWWSLGVVIYELCSGTTPFYAPHKPQIFKKITSVDFYCPNYFSDSIQMLLWNIFQLDIGRRFGSRIGHGVKDIKNHDWFNKIHWLSLANRKADPPYVPVVNLLVSTQGPSTSLNME